MNTSWLRHFATALALSTAFSACVIGDPDDDDGFGDDDGESGEGGSIGGRGGSGGRGGTGGRAGSGGTTGGGGSGGTATGGLAGDGAGGADEPTVECEPGSGPTSTPAANCTFAGPKDACLECLSANCCSELRNCYGVNPYNVCAYGGPEGFSEYLCIQACLVEREVDGPYNPNVDPGECGALCRTIPTGGTRACSLPGNYTVPVVDCMLADCEDACILDPAADLAME
jgi:hypothetical protein